jgi:GT2 family glycosyltransferase
VPHLVYVDSGSSDGSVEMATSLGAQVIHLDDSANFTAARARNAGFRVLRQGFPQLEYVQFVDGDCELSAEWLDRAVAALDATPQLAVVCGRRRERFPQQSVYNRLCDMEWNTPIGETQACGGDALMRVLAFEQVGGYRDTLIAGEEPELCLRLRRAGWRIERLDAEMTLHDASMTRWWQWFKRAQRAGHAYAEGAALHGRLPERHFVRETRRIVWWALAWPLLLLAASFWLGPIAWSGILIYLLQIAKIAVSRWRRAREPLRYCLIYAVDCVLAKWPQLVGVTNYWHNRWRGHQSPLIEYKSAAK